MTHPTRQRMVSGIVLAALSLGTIVGERLLRGALIETRFMTGWTLLAVVLLLAAFRLRKALVILPAGSAAGWLRLHIGTALWSAVLFFVHTGGTWPTGLSDTLLAAAYAGTFLSGVVGLTLSRTIPALLTDRGEEVLFERIPVSIRRLRDEFETLLIAAPAAPLVDFSACELEPFFAGPRNTGRHLLQSLKPRQSLLRQIDRQRKYLSTDGLRTADQLSALVRQKDDLDYHYALQGTLKLWLFVHVPLTYGLILFSLLHVLLVHAYG